MNQGDFKRYIEQVRDCDANLLDDAVNKGLIRAKDNRLDFKKIMNLAAMCAAAAVFCIVVNSEPIKIYAENFLINNSPISQNSSEVLIDYLNDMKYALTIYLGGH